MSRSLKLIFVTHDAGLVDHWSRAFKKAQASIFPNFCELVQSNPLAPALIWMDLSSPNCPTWDQADWIALTKTHNFKVIAASSNPSDSDAIQALDAGCAGYCHAFSDAATLVQVRQVVEAGHVWIGKTLMNRLIHSANSAASAKAPHSEDWGLGLSAREKEVAILAANGASNLAISQQCKIAERTVKAHMSAVFEKLNLTDRLQLALRVHGIH
jgi:DNA-binding NarL/FixJ family response regulator